jgi:hypothetical protein
MSDSLILTVSEQSQKRRKQEEISRSSVLKHGKRGTIYQRAKIEESEAQSKSRKNRTIRFGISE